MEWMRGGRISGVVKELVTVIWEFLIGGSKPLPCTTHAEAHFQAINKIQWAAIGASFSYDSSTAENTQ